MHFTQDQFDTDLTNKAVCLDAMPSHVSYSVTDPSCITAPSGSVVGNMHCFSSSAGYCLATAFGVLNAASHTCVSDFVVTF